MLKKKNFRLRFGLVNSNLSNNCILNSKPTIKSGFSVRNNPFNLCVRIVSSQSLFCSKKTGI